MDNLKLRHAATVSTLSLEVDHLQISLASDRRHTKRLKAALDDLSEDISRETYGRRREVSLRLALLLREATVAEGLQRWSRKARELFYQSAKGKGGTQASFEKCVEGAEALLQTLNGDISLDMDAHGSVARILAAQDAVSTFVQELHAETGKRMELERQRGHGLFSVPLAPTVATTPASRANAKIPTSPSALGTNKPIPLATASTPSPTKPDGLASSVNGALSSASEAHASIASPCWPSPSTVMNGDAKITATSADVAHMPSPSLLEENFAVDHQTPESEQEPNSSIAQARIEPGAGEPQCVEGSENNVVVASMDIVHQPAPRSLQGANFIHDGLSPKNKGKSSPLQLSRSPSTLPALKQGELHVLAHSVALPMSSTPLPTATIHPLTGDLDQVSHRYDSLQRAFRDCHLALKDLKNSISSISPITDTVAILRVAIQRLDDFNEDARVELEIRITDEELTTRGYQTLLNVPGAISDDKDQVEVENRIKAFVDGTEDAVARTIAQLHRKLDDLQHDVALVKKSLHDLPDLELQRPSTPQTPTGWSSWSNILGSPRAVSPAPPTFGTVMTSPRLRQSSTFVQSHASSGLSSLVESSPAPHALSDPFANLGLRISMPSQITPPNYIGVDQSDSPGSRPRKSSAMYMLGLGSRTSSLTLNSSQSANPARSSILTRWSDPEAVTDGETETDVEDELQTDVE